MALADLGQIDAMLLRLGLCLSELARVQCPLQEQPRGKLHEPRRQPHALRRVGDRSMPVEAARLAPSLPVEIVRRLLDETHALLEHGLELIGRSEMRSEIDCRFALAICALPVHNQTPLRLTDAIHKARVVKSSYVVEAGSIWCNSAWRDMRSNLRAN